jgi:hypothetical protein
MNWHHLIGSLGLFILDHEAISWMICALRSVLLWIICLLVECTGSMECNIVLRYLLVWVWHLVVFLCYFLILWICILFLYIWFVWSFVWWNYIIIAYFFVLLVQLLVVLANWATFISIFVLANGLTEFVSVGVLDTLHFLITFRFNTCFGCLHSLLGVLKGFFILLHFVWFIPK